MEGEELKQKLQDNKKSCSSSTKDVLPGGTKKLNFIEEKRDLLDESLKQLTAMSDMVRQ